MGGQFWLQNLALMWKGGTCPRFRPCQVYLRPGPWAVSECKQARWRPPAIHPPAPTPSGERDFSAHKAVTMRGT